jgi:hypothetical protein
MTITQRAAIYTHSAPLQATTPSITDEQQAAVDRAIAYGIDSSLMRESVKLTPTERVRRGEAFTEFALQVREAGRRILARKRRNAAQPLRDAANPATESLGRRPPNLLPCLVRRRRE